MIEAEIQEPVVKVGNLKSLRTYADVRDAVRAYYILVTKNPIAGEYYNISGIHTCEVGEMLENFGWIGQPAVSIRKGATMSLVMA